MEIRVPRGGHGSLTIHHTEIDGMCNGMASGMKSVNCCKRNDIEPFGCLCIFDHRTKIPKLRIYSPKTDPLVFLNTPSERKGLLLFRFFFLTLVPHKTTLFPFVLHRMNTQTMQAARTRFVQYCERAQHSHGHSTSVDDVLTAEALRLMRQFVAMASSREENTNNDPLSAEERSLLTEMRVQTSLPSSSSSSTPNSTHKSICDLARAINRLLEADEARPTVHFATDKARLAAMATINCNTTLAERDLIDILSDEDGQLSSHDDEENDKTVENEDDGVHTPPLSQQPLAAEASPMPFRLRKRTASEMCVCVSAGILLRV